MCALLFLKYGTKTSRPCQTWEKHLDLSFINDEWEIIQINTHKDSINVTTQKKLMLQLIAGWYRNPIQLHKFLLLPLCWRYGSAAESLLQLWWSCPKVQTFWREIHETITKITTLDFTPAQYLLHHSFLSKSTYHKLPSLLYHPPLNCFLFPIIQLP